VGILRFHIQVPATKDPFMIIAINLALLPVAFVTAMATLELLPWWRQLRQIRALPESIRSESRL
jgi:hypothetical protein